MNRAAAQHDEPAIVAIVTPAPDRGLMVRLGGPAVICAWTIALIYSGSLLLWAVTTNQFGIDFSVYWRAAREPLNAVYAPHGGYPFPYAPTMLLWIAPLAWLPFWVSFIGWAALGITALYLSARRYLSQHACALMLVSPPVVSGLVTGQVTAVLTAGLIWSMTTERRFFGGLALGAIATVKPQLILLAPLFLLLRRDWLAIAGSAVASVLIAGSAYAIYGRQMWWDWLHSMGQFRQVLFDTNIIRWTITPVGFADRFGLPLLPFWIIGAAVAVAILWTGRHRNGLHAGTAIAASSLLVAPYALIYDLTALAPFLALAVYRGSIGAAIALWGIINPLSLALAAVGLVRPRTISLNEKPARIAPDGPL